MVAGDTQKRTKRTRSEDTSTLEDHIQSRRMHLVRERRDVPEMRRRANEMLIEAGSMKSRWQTRVRLDRLPLPENRHQERNSGRPN